MGQPMLPVLSTHKTYLGDGLNNWHNYHNGDIVWVGKIMKQA